MTLNARSQKNQIGVHPDLVRVSNRAAEIEPHIITCGLRTIKEQQALKAAGKSKTLNSRHLTGHAIDFADPDGQYDIPDMKRIGAAYKQAAKELGIDIEWGGDWKGAWDTPHVQLSWKAYPASGITTTQKVVEASKSKPVIAGTATVAGGAIVPALPSLPAVPDLAPLTAWQGFGEQVSSLLSWSYQNPAITVGLVAWLGVVTFAPSVRLPWSRT
jgi:peptidoglycan LD-endopeptidase CwlK